MGNAMIETCPYCDAEMKEYEPSISGATRNPGRYCPECGAYRVKLISYARSATETGNVYWVEGLPNTNGSDA